jgi:CRP-like cAMP-binding protein
LANLIVDRKFKAGIKIFPEGQGREAALYFVREGKVSITNEEGTRKEVIEAGGYFGSEQLLADAAGELVHARESL